MANRRILLGFIEDLSNSIEWPAYVSQQTFRETLSYLLHNSRLKAAGMANDALVEAMIDLCNIYGFRLSDKRAFGENSAPSVSFELPLGLVMHGALIDSKSIATRNLPVTEIVNKALADVEFVILLDTEDNLEEQSSGFDARVSIISRNHFSNFIAALIAAKYYRLTYEEIPDKKEAASLLGSYYTDLQVSQEVLWGALETLNAS